MKPIPTPAEILQELRASADLVSDHIERANTQGKCRCIVFTGTENGVGTTLLAAATAMKMALYDQYPVLLLEMNLAAPRLAAYLGIPGTPGIAEILEGKSNFDGCARAVEMAPTLRVVPGGTARPPVPGELAKPDGRLLLEHAAERPGFVFLDTAPVLGTPETKTLLDHADGVVLVTRARSSRKQVAKRALHACELAGTPVLGVVLNRYKPERIFGF